MERYNEYNPNDFIDNEQLSSSGIWSHSVTEGVTALMVACQQGLEHDVMEILTNTVRI
jgi:hypothetical protein